MITIKENVNNVEEFNLLYDAVGWGKDDNEISKIALQNTLYSVSIYDDNLFYNLYLVLFMCIAHNTLDIYYGIWGIHNILLFV